MSAMSHADGAWRMWVFRRICYHLATPGIAHLARSESIFREQRFSDHAPITVEYELAL